MVELLVLVVEDSVVHQRLLAHAFEAAGVPARLEVYGDAERAWGVLDRMKHQSSADWPDFALIDVGLPGASGIELVDRIRQSRHFDGWPVVVLTASEDPDDEREALLAQATGYFMKPSTASGYASLVRSILAFLRRNPPVAARAGLALRPKPSPPDE
ncbi:MAG TPA: response regulator [Candidatus Thermoplasmatota archaeon]|nr:response regulator [Candidatus Thermoplasmatota archaeon]